ncbi:FtsX-like permease family protein [Chitinophaga agrisoli]|uniref:FtsX-like permease family protein n=1 Tax=Chitinophaga agrisoli TaxID=2607653 RepID=A0A5B2VTE9_9BACT|nr:ABC transporter permease [Chitinophaga agrisoli]KAA2242481.1 FtsX-like permease family protein [Chitinophaga agrisoli]
MLKNYLKIALRSLSNNKGFSAINIIGLAMGLATCLLLVFYVMDELSYDRYNVNADRIYRINNEVKFGDNHFDLAQSPPLLGPTLAKDLLQVEQYTRLLYHNSILVKKGQQQLRETKVVYADSTLFDVFTLPVLSGEPRTALQAPGSLVITERMARKYFNRTDVAGETVLIDNTSTYKITAVIRDLPAQSHFNFDFFISMSENAESRSEQSWFSQNYNTYLLLRKNTDPAKLTPEINKVMDAHIGPLLQSAIHSSLAEFKRLGNYARCTLMPLRDIHLHSNKIGELSPNSSIIFVYIFSAIALLILLIACANFMNLTTARSASRAREIGVRKLLGSFRKQLVAQFLAESLLVSFFSLVAALVIVVLLLPWFNGLADKHISIQSLFQPRMLACLAGLTLLVGLLAGSYPAFFLSAFQPVQVLKGKLATGFKGSWLRNALVVFQFSISIILITGTIVIYNQLVYIQHKDLGFDREQVLTIQNTDVLRSQTVSFKKELMTIGGIEDATMTSYLPVNGFRSSDTYFTSTALDQRSAIAMQSWTVDEHFISTFKMRLLSGRNFSANMPSDSNAFIINEAAVRFLGIGTPLDKKLYRLTDPQARKLQTYNIIGVVRNFNFNSLRDEITPLALNLGLETSSITVRLRSADIPGILAQIEKKWLSFSPGQPLAYAFTDDSFDNLYKTDQRTGRIVTTFAVLAVLIACLGLFGLSMYAARQRVKEIGIRKVLGASIANIAGMLSKDFLKLVLIAAVIAFPLAQWVMQQWLQGFAYRTHISWWIFVLAGAATLLIALLTISVQAVKAAVANPAVSLKAE